MYLPFCGIAISNAQLFAASRKEYDRSRVRTHLLQHFIKTLLYLCTPPTVTRLCCVCAINVMWVFITQYVCICLLIFCFLHTLFLHREVLNQEEMCVWLGKHKSESWHPYSVINTFLISITEEHNARKQERRRERIRKIQAESVGPQVIIQRTCCLHYFRVSHNGSRSVNMGELEKLLFFHPLP